MKSSLKEINARQERLNFELTKRKLNFEEKEKELANLEADLKRREKQLAGLGPKN